MIFQDVLTSACVEKAITHELNFARRPRTVGFTGPRLRRRLGLPRHDGPTLYRHRVIEAAHLK